MGKYLLGWLLFLKKTSGVFMGSAFPSVGSGLFGNFISRSWPTCFALLRCCFCCLIQSCATKTGKRPVRFLIFCCTMTAQLYEFCQLVILGLDSYCLLFIAARGESIAFYGMVTGWLGPDFILFLLLFLPMAMGNLCYWFVRNDFCFDILQSIWSDCEVTT